MKIILIFIIILFCSCLVENSKKELSSKTLTVDSTNNRIIYVDTSSIKTIITVFQEYIIINDIENDKVHKIKRTNND